MNLRGAPVGAQIIIAKTRVASVESRNTASSASLIYTWGSFKLTMKVFRTTYKRGNSFHVAITCVMDVRVERLGTVPATVRRQVGG